MHRDRKNIYNVGGKKLMTIYQSKLSKEAKRIKREMKLPWSCCKWAAKRRTGDYK